MITWKEVPNGHELKVKNFRLGVYASPANWILKMDGAFAFALSNESTLEEAKARCLTEARRFFSSTLDALASVESVDAEAA